MENLLLNAEGESLCSVFYLQKFLLLVLKFIVFGKKSNACTNDIVILSWLDQI